jgi:hypothetical protein
MQTTKTYRVGILDTILILVLAFTADLFLLWIAAQMGGLNLFSRPPDWLEALSKNVWKYVTGGAAGSVLLSFLRQRIDSSARSPNYLLWSSATSTGILVIVVALALVIKRLNPPPQHTDVTAPPSKFDLKFRVKTAGGADKTGDTRGLDFAFQQIQPRVGGSSNWARQQDGFYEVRGCDLPPPCGQFSGNARRADYTSVYSKAPTSDPTVVFFVRSPKDPATVQPTVEVWEDCEEGKTCSIYQYDYGWALKGKEGCPHPSGAWLRGFAAVAYADEKSKGSVQPGWRVPSLQTLSNMKEKVGFTRFLIQSGPLPSLSEADSFTYYIKVNDTPIYVNGAPREDMVEPFKASKGVNFAFGLENLNFSGADRGCENISVLFEFRKQDQVIQRAEVARRYAALRDAEREELQSTGGISFSWSGNYVKPLREDKFEVFIRSTPDVKEAADIKRRLDKAKVRFQDQEVVGVVRPPLDNNEYGIVVGLLQPTGQVRFTFDEQTASRLLMWVTGGASHPNLSSIIHRGAFVYPMKPGDSGVGRYGACSGRSPV